MTVPSPAPLPRAWLRTCLLVVLAEGRSHGYDLLQQVRAMGLRSADTAGVYRALRSMERDDLVVPTWEPSPSGPPRRSYTLTTRGRSELRDELSSAHSVHSLLGALLHRAGSVVR